MLWAALRWMFSTVPECMKQNSCISKAPLMEHIWAKYKWTQQTVKKDLLKWKRHKCNSDHLASSAVTTWGVNIKLHIQVYWCFFVFVFFSNSLLDSSRFCSLFKKELIELGRILEMKLRALLFFEFTTEHGSRTEGWPLSLTLSWCGVQVWIRQPAVTADHGSCQPENFSRQSRFITKCFQARLMPGLHWRIALWCSHWAQRLWLPHGRAMVTWLIRGEIYGEKGDGKHKAINPTYWIMHEYQMWESEYSNWEAWSLLVFIICQTVDFFLLLLNDCWFAE